MHFVRYINASGDIHIGITVDFRTAHRANVNSIGELLGLRMAEIRATAHESRGDEEIIDTLLPPVDGHAEVWAAGVTYRQSQHARIEESTQASVYELVYDAARPEIFFKSVAWRTSGHQERIAIRDDSAVNVPEPELAVVCNRFGEIVGYTICNDVSSRSLEGENPLYLPQAKIYAGACAIGPGIRPAWEIADPYALSIQLKIHRRGTPVWTGESSTAELHRKLPDLVDYLFHGDNFPSGAVLSTGTALVPPLPFTLTSGDIVTISIDELGTLSNSVVEGKAAMSWLTARHNHAASFSAAIGPAG